MSSDGLPLCGASGTTSDPQIPGRRLLPLKIFQARESTLAVTWRQALQRVLEFLGGNISRVSSGAEPEEWFRGSPCGSVDDNLNAMNTERDLCRLCHIIQARVFLGTASCGPSNPTTRRSVARVQKPSSSPDRGQVWDCVGRGGVGRRVPQPPNSGGLGGRGPPRVTRRAWGAAPHRTGTKISECCLVCSVNCIMKAGARPDLRRGDTNWHGPSVF